MNERIKELAEQAGMTDDKYGMFFAKDFDSHCADGVDLEKFAELIVRECADIGERYADGNYEVPRQILARFGMDEEEE